MPSTESTQFGATGADVELARHALLEITAAESVGEPAGSIDEGDGVVSLYFTTNVDDDDDDDDDDTDDYVDEGDLLHAGDLDGVDIDDVDLSDEDVAIMDTAGAERDDVPH